MSKTVNNFIVRVYGLWLHCGEILLSHEQYKGRAMTKFPGGGLEWGEGLADCLKREFKEELQLDIQVGELFYINDFFQASAFHQGGQLISVYYKVNAEKNKLNQYCVTEHQWEWVPVSKLNSQLLTWPVDQMVAQKLVLEFS